MYGKTNVKVHLSYNLDITILKIKLHLNVNAKVNKKYV